MDQVVGHLLGDLARYFLLGLRRRGAQMGCRHDIVQFQKQAAFGRFGLEHIERGPGDMAGLKRLIKCRLVDDTAARAIDDPDAGFGLGQLGSADQIAGRVVQRRMDRDNIGASHQLTKLDPFDTKFPCTLGRQERIVDDHPHAQPLGTASDDRADIAAADQAQHFAGKLDADKTGFLPLALAHGTVGGRDLARQRHHHGDRVLGRRDGVAERRVHHNDAALGGRRHVDIVDANAGASDDLEVFSGGDHLRRRFGRGTHRKTIIGGNAGDQVFRTQAGLDIDLDAAFAKNVGGVVAQLVGNQDFRHSSAPHPGLIMGPCEPRQQGLHVSRVDGGATPYPQTRRRTAMGADIVGDGFCVESGGHGLGFGVGIDQFETYRCRRPGFRRSCEEVDPGRLANPAGKCCEVCLAARDQGLKAADIFGPPKAVERILDAQHGGCVDGFACEDTFDEFALLGQPEDFWQRPGHARLQPFDGARAQGQHAVAAFTAQHLLPRPGDNIEPLPRQIHGECGRGGVADGKTLSVGRDPVSIGNTDTRCRAIPGEDHVARPVDISEVRQVAIFGIQDTAIGQAEFVPDVAGPLLAEVLPGQQVDAAAAEQRPQRQFDGAGIGCRHDSQPVAIGDAKQVAATLDHLGKFGLASLRPVRSPQECIP